jgi:hypothetical protein
MSGPGKGRYTTYVGKASARNTLLWKLFNKKAPNDAGVFYGGQEPSDNNAAAAAVTAVATAPVNGEGVGGLIPSNGQQVGDVGMFPTGVDLTYGKAPNLSDVKWNVAGDPANPYAPDISSPGPGRTQGIDKDVNPGLSVGDLKPNYVPAAPGTGTVSPSTTSGNIGGGSIGQSLEKGKSSV